MSHSQSNATEQQQPEAVYVWWSAMDQGWRVRKWDMQSFAEGTKYVREGLASSETRPRDDEIKAAWWEEFKRTRPDEPTRLLHSKSDDIAVAVVRRFGSTPSAAAAIVQVLPLPPQPKTVTTATHGGRPMTMRECAEAEETSVDARGLLANVIEHWEQVPNDIRSDPGMDNLNAAIHEADKELGGASK